MKPFYILLLAVGLFLSGCDMMNIRQYEVSAMTSSSADVAKLKTVLQSVADKSGLKASQPLSASSNCLAYYSGGDVILDAHFYDSSALIQLTFLYGTPPGYKQTKHAGDLLESALAAEFGGRVSVPKRFVQTP